MYPRLRSVPIQSPRIDIARQPIHDCPANRTRFIDLQSQIIMHARYWVVMLMYDEMTTVGVLIASVEILEGWDGESRWLGGAVVWCPYGFGKVGREVF